MGIAWKPEEATEALKEFIGQVIATDYSEEPFGMKGAPEIKRTGKVLCLQIRTDVYDKDQYEWYPPSRVKKTKSVGIIEMLDEVMEYLFPIDVKWLYFIEALNETGAMRDLSIAGANDEERMSSLAKSLLGMKFRFNEVECESLVKEKSGVLKRFNVLLPVEYLGKEAIEAAVEVKQAMIGEVSTEAKPEV